MLNGVRMNGNPITGLGAGAVNATSTDAINSSQLYAATRYFHANSALADATATGTDSLTIGTRSGLYRRLIGGHRQRREGEQCK
jgi:autotransporter adhesin